MVDALQLRAFQGNNHDLSVNVYAKADTLEPGEKALLGKVGMRWLRRSLRVDVTLHKPAIKRLFATVGMPSDTPCTIRSVCRAVSMLFVNPPKRLDENSPKSAGATGRC
jgi:hypothetical protein